MALMDIQLEWMAYVSTHPDVSQVVDPIYVVSTEGCAGWCGERAKLREKSDPSTLPNVPLTHTSTGPCCSQVADPTTGAGAPDKPSLPTLPPAWQPAGGSLPALNPLMPGMAWAFPNTRVGLTQAYHLAGALQAHNAAGLRVRVFVCVTPPYIL